MGVGLWPWSSDNLTILLKIFSISTPNTWLKKLCSFLFVNPWTFIFWYYQISWCNWFLKEWIFLRNFFHDLKDYIMFLHEFSVKVWVIFSSCSMICQLEYSSLLLLNHSKLCNLLPYLSRNNSEKTKKHQTYESERFDQERL